MERTPDLLPVLKEAGVVDAGGAGFLLLLDVLLHVTDGRPVPEATEATDAPVDVAVQAAHDEVSDLRYEVMYLLEADDETIPRFKDVWAGVAVQLRRQRLRRGVEARPGRDEAKEAHGPEEGEEGSGSERQPLQRPEFEHGAHRVE